MKRFNDLSYSKKNYAVESALQILIHHLLIQYRKVSDPALQKIVDEAFAKTNKMNAEWRGAEWLYDNHRDLFMPMALADASDAYFPERDECVITGIA
jgi:ABC-type taurine transport system substrate-binding protein